VVELIDRVVFKKKFTPSGYPDIIRYFKQDFVECQHIQKNILIENKRRIPITKMICQVFKVDESRLFDKTRKQDVVDARRCLIYILRIKQKWGLRKTAKLVRQTHPNIIFSCKKFVILFESDKQFNNKSNKILRMYDNGNLIIEK
jgi:chromosomal replication initiation ATPase DnaA